MTPSLSALMLGTLVSEDLTVIAAALLVREGALDWGPAAASCAAGIYVGDLLLWVVGRLVGARVLPWPRVARVLPDGQARLATLFEQRAGLLILGSRLTPGTRLPLYVAAGACRMPFRRFAGWTLVAVLAWTPLLMALAMTLGGVAVGAAVEWLGRGVPALAAGGGLVLASWRLAPAFASRRGRQRLTARASRLWRWEFWPMWVFYAPVGVWTLWLAARHGGFRTLTAANPGIPDGGVVGESKFRILSSLPVEWIIPSVLIEPGPAADRRRTLALASSDWMLPVVLKPDVGQRGVGVRIARTLADAETYLTELDGPVLVQPYHPGPYEAGIFYYRWPSQPSGRILCITDKHFPSVTGDGHSTLEDLVWAHPRYRMQARTFLTRLAARRTVIPPAGETVALGHAGNHAQGTMFTDGVALLTPELEARVDTIARACPGFYIGRFDVRYRDRAAFMAGEDLAIVELNGATAECTNIYDPSRSLLAAYRQLFRQWRLVFEIGAANRRAGHDPSSGRRLLHLLKAHITTSVRRPVSD